MRPARRGILFRLSCVAVIIRGTVGFAADAWPLSTVSALDVGAQQVTIYLSAPSDFTQAALPKDVAHQRPDRCYLDVSAALGRHIKSMYAVNSESIQQVRAAQFRPQTVRIVLDLVTLQPCRVEQMTGPDRLRITVGHAVRASNIDIPLPRAARTASEMVQPSSQPEMQSVVQPEPDVQNTPPENPADNPIDQPAVVGKSGYLDLRTPFSSGTQQANPISLFGQQVIEDQSPQLAPRGLYLLQGEEQE